MHRQEQSSFRCLPVSVQVPGRCEMEKEFFFFFPPSKELCYLIVLAVKSEACKGKEELSTHGASTHLQVRIQKFVLEIQLF